MQSLNKFGFTIYDSNHVSIRTSAYSARPVCFAFVEVRRQLLLPALDLACPVDNLSALPGNIRR
jgi:hypothetical protein